MRTGLSQVNLAIAIGVEPSSARNRGNRYETARHEPPFLTADRLAKVLRVPTPFLYAENDDLAAWIVAFDCVRPSLRRQVVRVGREALSDTVSPRLSGEAALRGKHRVRKR